MAQPIVEQPFQIGLNGLGQLAAHTVDYFSNPDLQPSIAAVIIILIILAVYGIMKAKKK
jgi:hypothetical protein